MIFELNYDNQAKELLEGQRRYREQMNSQYTAGYTDAEEKANAEKEQLHNKISEQEATIANKDAKIEQLEAELAKFQKSMHTRY